MGIRVTPISKESKANSYSKALYKWKNRKPERPEGISDFTAKIIEGKIKPGKKPNYAHGGGVRKTKMMDY